MSGGRCREEYLERNRRLSDIDFEEMAHAVAMKAFQEADYALPSVDR